MDGGWAQEIQPLPAEQFAVGRFWEMDVLVTVLQLSLNSTTNVTYRRTSLLGLRDPES